MSYPPFIAGDLLCRVLVGGSRFGRHGEEIFGGAPVGELGYNAKAVLFSVTDDQIAVRQRGERDRVIVYLAVGTDHRHAFGIGEADHECGRPVGVIFEHLRCGSESACRILLKALLGTDERARMVDPFPAAVDSGTKIAFA